MSIDHDRVQSLFLSAVEKPSDVRSAFLDEQCGDDSALKDRVLELVVSHEETGSFMDREPACLLPTQQSDPSEAVGEAIGPYKLREKIAEGGMGVVFVAEQERPIRRKVAIKLIKPGMDSKSVIARFEAEQQALAMMNHRNIAKVLDAGIAASGRPYFVMELVQGIPFTEYCDQKRLGIRDRLQLFAGVCQGIQHAHQKGIIHRDIKPSNILVTEEDGEAVPKIIDFGVAKALSQKLTDRTVYTSYCAFLGTPLYASPEQASLSNVDVDTRSDVYSLGVVLYELITGSTPFDKSELHEAAYDEMCRIIREKQPSKPSTRISTLGDSATGISSRRNTDPNRLIQSVRGDLDWIVMKALEKDRGRRYEGASGLAADIERMLDDKPVEARPPSAAYRFSRFAKRNREWVASSAVAIIAILAGVIGLAMMYLHAENQLRATQALVIEKVMTQAISGEVAEAERTLKTYEGVFDDDRWPRTLRGLALLHSARNDEAITVLENVAEAHPSDIPANAALAIAYVHNGKWQEGIECASRITRNYGDADLSDFEEYFLGYAFLYLDCRESARILQSVVDKHPSWFMARASRAGALAHVAERTRSVHDIDAAFEELEKVKVLAEANPFIQMMSVFVCKNAIDIYRINGLDTAEFETIGRHAVARLRSYDEYSLGVAMSAQFADVTGDSGEANRLWDSVLKLGDGFWSEFGVAHFLADHSTESTMGLIESLPNAEAWEVRLARAYVLADTRDRRQEAIDFFEQEIRPSESPFHWYKGIQILLLLGEHERAKESLEQSRQQFDVQTRQSIVHEMDALQIVLLDEPPQIDSDNGEFQELLMCALWHISRGNRSDALRYLDYCEQFAFTDLSGYWSRAYKKRLDTDAEWPRGNPNFIRQANSETPAVTE